MKAHGTVHKYGDNVDTDVIIPARYLTTADPAGTYMPPTRAAAELGKAAEELRTLTYHVHLFGEEGEYAFRVPGSWEFVLGAYGDISFYEDAGLTKPTENKIPADGQDHEIWVSDAKG